MQHLFHQLLKNFVNYYKKIEMRQFYCHGKLKRLHLGKNISTMNTIFNVSSGEIYIGDDTIFGHNCMVLTGRHDFIKGKRKKIVTGGRETPAEGYNIHIGRGCWIASGVIIIGGVTIGDNVIIGAGAVITHDIPSGVFAAGVPAKVIYKHEVLKE